MRRKLLAVLLVPALLALGACGDDDESSDSGPSPEATGIDGVSVGGAFGDQPTFNVDATVTADSTEVKTLSEGDGDVVKSGDSVTINYIGVIAGSDQPFDSSWARQAPATFTVESGPNSLLPGLVKAIEGQREGSRVVAVVPPSEGFGEAGNSTVGIQSDSMLVFVIDILEPPEVNTSDLSGVTVEGKFGDEPNVDFEPVMSVDKTEIKTLKKGDGAEVKTSDEVTVNYQGINGRTGDEFDSSWTTGKPATFSLSGVVPGFSKAIAGQTIGSRVLVAIPPEDGYGTSGNPQAGIQGTDTLVFVIDIIKVTEPKGQGQDQQQ
ncbi:MAG TPA: FKBP-type peptidyl-prolyl cis-trans isomerase [Nocardioidaceae bacterium]|nr:FKBP-type peptidyl-prolyl cis-trans isomerase [Nocardioidaceae bacterium]